MGAPVHPDRIVTAARATALALADRPDPPHRHGVRRSGPGHRELRDAGLGTVAPTDAGLAAGPDAVAVGIDLELTHERLSVAADAIRGGALFAATNRDPVYPIDGRLRAGAGSIVAALATAAGREPDLVVGKPEPGLFRQAAQAVGLTPDQAIVIGDGLRTDILAAHRVGRAVRARADGRHDARRARCGGADRAADGGRGRTPRSSRPSSRSWPSSTIGAPPDDAHATGPRAGSGGRCRRGFAREPGIERVQQLRPRGLVVVEERDLVGVAHDARDARGCDAQALDAARQLADERQVADRAVVGRDRDGHAGVEQPGQGSVPVPRADAGLDVARRAEVERHAAPRAARP